MLQPITKDNFPQMLGRFTTGELENLIQKFPYFQQAHLLLAKKYQQENNPKFDQQLQLAALYTQDRELLFTLFHQNNYAIPENKPKVEVALQVKQEPIELALPEVAEDEKSILVEARESIPETVVEAVKDIEVTPIIDKQEEPETEVVEAVSKIGRAHV